MKGRWIPYSSEEMSWLEERKEWVISELHRAFQAAFARQDVSAGNLHSLRKRKGWKTGRTGQFAKGAISHNKGKKCAPGKGGNHPNARKTQFAKGVRQGVAARLWKPIGTERLCKDGYLEVKIHDGMPLQSRWRAVHLVRWEKINGPIPKGLCLKCLDGDKLNTDPANWEAIPRAMLPRLAGGNRYKNYVEYDSAPPELKPTILATAKIEHRARAMRKAAESS